MPMKFLVFIGIAVVLYRLIRGRWPWVDILGEHRKDANRSQAKARASALLGVSDGASREDIIDAHRRLVAQVHPDRGGTNDLVHEANSARDLLLGDLALRTRERT